MIQLLINEACNNHCKFCAVAANRLKFVKRSLVVGFINKAFTYPDTEYDRRVVFAGGEPSINPDLPYYIEYIKSRYDPVEIGIITNARAFHSERLAGEIASAGAEWALCSLYGSCSETCDQITRRDGSFCQTVLGIKNLHAAGLHVEVRTLLHRQMILELDRFVDLAVREFPFCWQLSAVTLDYVGNAPEFVAEIGVSIEEVATSFKSAAYHAKSLGWGLRLVCFPLCYLPQDLWSLVIPAEAVPRHFLSWERITHDYTKKYFVQRQGCEKCLMQGLCPGVASSYIDFHPDMAVYPITQLNLELDKDGCINSHNGEAVLSSKKSGNWMFFKEPEISIAITELRFADAPVRIQKEFLRQELVRVASTSEVKALCEKREEIRDRPKKLFDWNFFIYNVTNRCNLRCKYCYTEKSSVAEAPILDVLQRIGQWSDGDFCIEVHGNGEPLVRFKELKMAIPVFLASISNKKKLVLLLVTNGTLINGEVARFLKEQEFAVIVSLDGPEKIHNLNRLNRRGQGTYAEVMKGIRILQDHDVPMSINSVVCMADQETVLSVFEHHVANGFYRMKFIPVVPTNTFRDELNVGIFNDAMKEIAVRVIEWNSNKTRPRIEVLNLSYAVLSILGIPNRYMCMEVPCGAGTKSITINPNGDIFPCHKVASLPEWKVGNIIQASRRELIEQHQAMTDFCLARNKFTGDCGACAFSGFCGGICFADYYLNKISGRVIPRNFDCLREVIWDLIGMSEDNPQALQPLMLVPRLGDLV